MTLVRNVPKVTIDKKAAAVTEAVVNQEKNKEYAAGTSSKGIYGTTQQFNDLNNRLASDAGFRASETQRANQVIAERTAKGLDTKAQMDYLAKINSLTPQKPANNTALAPPPLNPVQQIPIQQIPIQQQPTYNAPVYETVAKPVLDKTQVPTQTAPQQQTIPDMKEAMQKLIDLIVNQSKSQKENISSGYDAQLAQQVAEIEKIYNASLQENEQSKVDAEEDYQSNVEGINEDTYRASELGKVGSEIRGIGNSAQFQALQQGTLSRASRDKLNAAVARDKTLSSIASRIQSLKLNKDLSVTQAKASSEFGKLQATSAIDKTAFEQQFGLQEGAFEFDRSATREDALINNERAWQEKVAAEEKAWKEKLTEYENQWREKLAADERNFQASQAEAERNWQQGQIESDRNWQEEQTESERTWQEEMVGSEREWTQKMTVEERAWMDKVTQKEYEFAKWMQKDSQTFSAAEAEKARNFQSYLTQMGFNHDITMFNKNSALTKSLQSLQMAQEAKMFDRQTAERYKFAAFENSMQVANEVKKYTPGTPQYQAMMSALNIERNALKTQAKDEFQYAKKYMELEQEMAQSAYEQNLTNIEKQYTPGTREYAIQEKMARDTMNTAINGVSQQISQQTIQKSMENYISDYVGDYNHSLFEKAMSSFNKSMTKLLTWGDEAEEKKIAALKETGDILYEDSELAETAYWNWARQYGLISDSEYKKMVD